MFSDSLNIAEHLLNIIMHVSFFETCEHAFLKKKLCYNFDNLVDYAKNVNIIRAKFSEHIKRIFKNVQKILIDWISKVLSRTLILIKKQVFYL